MHLYLYPRGIFDRVELWKSMMQAHFWQWTRKNLKTGLDEKILVQGALRPTIWGAYEYIFPADCLAEVLAVIGASEQHSWKMPLMRPFFNVKKIPKEVWEEAKKLNVSVLVNGTKRGLSHTKIEGVATEIIGIKEDHEADWADFGVHQEML
jgi:hypothetical protein